MEARLYNFSAHMIKKYLRNAPRVENGYTQWSVFWRYLLSWWLENPAGLLQVGGEVFDVHIVRNTDKRHIDTWTTRPFTRAIHDQLLLNVVYDSSHCALYFAACEESLAVSRYICKVLVETQFEVCLSHEFRLHSYTTFCTYSRKCALNTSASAVSVANQD